MARPEALAGMIFGSLAVAVPAEEPALAVDRDLAMEEARDSVSAMALDLGLVADSGRAVEVVGDSEPVAELSPALDRVVAPGRAELDRVVEVAEPGQS
jgi:hypothetical protein